MSVAVVSSVENHVVCADDACTAVPWAGRVPARDGDRRPSSVDETELVEVATVRPVVPPEDVEGLAVHHCRVRMSGSGKHADTVQRTVDFLPDVLIQIERMNVVHPKAAVESAEYDEQIAVDDRRVTIATGRGDDWDVQNGPAIGLKVVPGP